MKVFISYSTHNEDSANQIKKILEKFNINCFMASDNINASVTWRERIINEIENCDIFISVLSEDFKNSKWCPQEVGIAYYCKYNNRDIQIIPLWTDGTEPFGFIDEIEGQEFNELNLLASIFEKHIDYMIPESINALGSIYGYRRTEKIMLLLRPYYKVLSDEQVNELVKNAIKNDQVHDAGQCKTEYLPEFIKINKSRISSSNLKDLEDLIKED